MQVDRVGDGIGLCDGLKNDPYRLLCLNVWSLVGGTVWEGIGDVVLLEEICHWRWVWGPFPVSPYLPPACRSDVSAQLFPQSCLCPAVMDLNL